MIRNGIQLVESAPIKNMLLTKEREHGVSHGLAEVGYDIRIKQAVSFFPKGTVTSPCSVADGVQEPGHFRIASAIEEFDMPDNLCAIVHDKSTWARRGLSVFNTVIEPGWKGFLTLELVYHGQEELHIPAGAGIAQVIFHHIASPVTYKGKYQNQADEPVSAIIT